MDTATPDPQDPINVLTAVLSAPLRVDEEQDLAVLERRIGDPEAARRVLDAVRAAAFVEEEDLAPGMALDYQVRAFGELHGREHGGTWDPARPIDLDSIGRRIPLYATQPLAMLASIGGGRAHRLRSGLLSLPNTPDSRLRLCAVETGEQFQITAWTTASPHPWRRWWLRATLAAPAKATEITFAVAAADPVDESTPAGPPAAFVERSGALLGLPVADWCRSRRSGRGTFRATIQTVGPADVPCWSDVVAAR
ncbi:hypothetical protein ACGFJT_41885 [Actinomadura geliboluensis]|uniref:hypothetical protein n=1 Tax=Actinomadura geliboluensis TaxID=882440 RepID=UPI003719E4E9